MTKRWVMMVKQSKIDQEPSVEKVNAMVVKLLARQHRAMVRKVKRLRKSQKFPPIMQNSWYQAACDDILAALAKQGGG